MYMNSDHRQSNMNLRALIINGTKYNFCLLTSSFYTQDKEEMVNASFHILFKLEEFSLSQSIINRRLKTLRVPS